MGVYVPLLYGAQVEIFHNYAGQIIENRLWFAYDNPPFGTVELQGLTDGVASWWTGFILPELSVELNTLTVAARDWSGASPSPYTITNVAQLGGRLIESHSANVAVVVPFKNPFGVRLKRNKNYIPGVPLDAVNLNTVVPAFADYLYEGYSALIDLARLFSPVLNWRWVIASAYSGGSVRADQLWYTSNGPPPASYFRLGQRRRRLP